MDDDDPVPRGVNVELDGVGAALKGPLERRKRVFRELPLRPAVSRSVPRFGLLLVGCISVAV